MSDLTPGTRVRIVRPDRPEHGVGVVSDRGSPIIWDVWVTHSCDCWEPGVTGDHTRGYDRDEVVPDE